MSNKEKHPNQSNFQNHAEAPLKLGAVHPIIRATRCTLPDGASLLRRMHKVSELCVRDLRNLAEDESKTIA